MFAPPTWLLVVVYLSSVAVFVSKFFASPHVLPLCGCCGSSCVGVFAASPLNFSVLPSTWCRDCVLSSYSCCCHHFNLALRSPVPAVMSGSLVRDSDDSRDFVVFVF